MKNYDTLISIFFYLMMTKLFYMMCVNSFEFCSRNKKLIAFSSLFWPISYFVGLVALVIYEENNKDL